jgi:hypothetical protein
MAEVSYDDRAVTIDGERTLIISGAIHYPRSQPSMWPDILRRSREAGLNCVETYVFWEGHEPQEGCYDFTGRFDLPRFLEACAEEGLHVILRIGPYVCAEWNFGGLAWWLTTKEGMVTRTWNRPFMREVERWLKVLMARVGEYQATRGGPIVLAQLENEYNNVAARYGDDGPRYLRWVIEAGRSAGIEVPLIMCEGAGEDAIETLNGFSVLGRMDATRSSRPGQPLLWTENWPGWYDTFGNSHHLRRPEELAYQVARFFGSGGTGVNYYMWHGGTNFARDAMLLQATSYDFDAPLDEYGLPTAKSRHLERLHRALHENARFLLHGKPATPEVLSAESEPGKCDDFVLYRWVAEDGEFAFLCNGTPEDREAEALGGSFRVPANATMLLRVGGDGGGASAAEVVFKSWEFDREAERREMKPVEKRFEWHAIEEPLPDDVTPAQRRTVEVNAPVDMLPFTRDETDYAWYLTEVESDDARAAMLEAEYVGDIMSVWVNGRHQGTVPERLTEERKDRKLFRQSIEVHLEKGSNSLAILVASAGLIKGDWMIDAPQSEEKKGLAGEVRIDGKPLAGPWGLEIGLWGERMRLYEPAAGSVHEWRPAAEATGRLRWYRCEVELGEDELTDTAPWALHLGEPGEGLGKGLIWVNGRCIGRYWQLPSEDLWSPHGGHEFIVETGAGRPTQEYYHVPREYLARRNTIVVFEERGGKPGGVRFVRPR